MTSDSVPPVLPVTNSQPTANAESSHPPVATAAFHSFLSNFSQSARNSLSTRRPWSELVDRNAFNKPDSVSEATLRIGKNYSYFRVNYLAIIALVIGVSLLSNPFSLLVLIGLLASWMFLYLFRPSDQPLALMGRTYTDFEVLSILGALTVFVIFLTNVGSIIVSALLAGVALVCAHGAFRVPEDLFMDNQDGSQATGFLSFMRGVASTAPVTASALAPPTGSGRV